MAASTCMCCKTSVTKDSPGDGSSYAFESDMIMLEELPLAII